MLLHPEKNLYFHALNTKKLSLYFKKCLILDLLSFVDILINIFWQISVFLFLPIFFNIKPFKKSQMFKWEKEREKSFWKDREVNREHSVHVAKIMFYMKRKNAHKHTDTHLDVCKTDGFIFKHSGKKKVWLSYVNYFWKKKNAKYGQK